MDVLSDTLQVVRLTGAIFLDARLTAPWAFESPTQAELAQYLRLPSDCVALFHVLVRGTGWFVVPGYKPVRLQKGDAILLPHSTPHRMSSDHRTPSVPISSIVPPYPTNGIVAVASGGLGEATQFICGFLHCDHRFNPLLGALPPLIVVHARCVEDAEETVLGTMSGERQGVDVPVDVLHLVEEDWLRITLQHMVDEALGERPGSTEMLGRLTEILFVEVVRRYMQQLPATDHGWLAGVRDPIVGQALRLLHAQPERAWTVEELAEAVAVARSTLALHFTTLIGESPMHYLTAWRIQLAKGLMKQSPARLADIAARVGYESEAAFSRAFRRHVGQPPAMWRETAVEQ